MTTQEDFNMILGINPKIFNKKTGDIGFEYCKKLKCKTMMEWDCENDIWYCPKCHTKYK